MTHTLKKFGFTGPILSAILALYSSPCAQVYTSNMLSRPFSIANGTRQGCPLSPSIFNRLIEPLAEKVRAHPGIPGFSLQGKSHNINLFADDIILFLTSPCTSLLQSHDILNKCIQISYYKVNFKKSLILGLKLSSHLQSHLQNAFPYTWNKSSIPYLGLQITALKISRC